MKIKVSSKENISNLHIPGYPEFFPLKVVRDEKTGKVKESKGEIEIEDADFEKVQELGKKYGFTIKKV